MVTMENILKTKIAQSLVKTDRTNFFRVSQEKKTSIARTEFSTIKELS